MNSHNKRSTKKTQYPVLTWLSKGNRLEIIVYGLIAVSITSIILIRSGSFDNVELFDLKTFSSVVIAAVIAVVVSALKDKIYNRIEDKIKLTTDYAGLVGIYETDKEHMVKAINGSSAKEDQIIPVYRVADLSACDVEIIDDANSGFELPFICESNYKELLSSHSSSVIYNNINIRVDNWDTDRESGRFTLYTGRTTYFNSLVTNRSMDFLLDNTITVRQVLEPGPIINPLNKSAMSNHLGFNGMVETSDNYFVLVYRGSTVSIAKRTYGNSVGASLKTKYALANWPDFTKEGLLNSIKEEIVDELKVRETINCDNIKLISAYRDLVEGGKPQLFFYYKLECSKDELLAGFAAYNKAKIAEKANRAKANNKKQKELQMVTDGKVLECISRESLLSKGTEVYPDRLICCGKEYNMVPSAAACMVFLIEYLLKEKSASDNDR